MIRRILHYVLMSAIVILVATAMILHHQTMKRRLNIMHLQNENIALLSMIALRTTISAGMSIQDWITRVSIDTLYYHMQDGYVEYIITGTKTGWNWHLDITQDSVHSMVFINSVTATLRGDTIVTESF